MPRPQYTAVLTQKTALSDNTIELVLTFEQKTVFLFEAGQFVQLLFEHNGKTHKRSYSIANSPEEVSQTRALRIAISAVAGGMATDYFATAAIGSVIQVTGPFGVLTLAKEIPGQLILVGTGTGVAPYHSMIPQLERLADKGTPITLVMGGRYRRELIYRDAFMNLAQDYPVVDYSICLSRESSENLKTREHTGYVQHLFNHLNLAPGNDIVYLCGNPAMVDDAARALQGLSFANKKIKREKYVYSGH
ncbi:ferredoxin--NADP reductase [Candidatus Sororendozoicomonas aggregata]|uniref:ferredoxin--NADP reductase n=1 Tax=Candidatus Sororendozoicomonas aggregata TaxID=3073239 RepID=UPI002ED181B8